MRPTKIILSLALVAAMSTPVFAGPLHDVIVAAKAEAKAEIATAKVNDAGNLRAFAHDYAVAVTTAFHAISAEVKICAPTHSC